MRAPESAVHVCREVERTERDLFSSGKRQGLRVDDIRGAVLFSCREIPLGTFNYASGISAGPAGIDELLDKIEDFYARLGLSTRVAITPLSRPRDLRSRVLKRGYRRSSTSDVMIIDGDVAPRRRRAGLGVRLVRKGQVEAFSSIFNSALKIPTSLRGAFTRFWRSAVSYPDPRLRIYLAAFEEDPAGVGLIFIGEEAAGIYFVATQPGHRGRGVATSLVSQAVHDAFASSCTFVYLYASRRSGARSMYRSLGFASKYVRAVYSLRPSIE